MHDKRIRITMLAVAIVSLGLASATAADLRLSDRTIVRLATIEQGRAVLGKSDLYTKSQSDFDRKVRLRTADDVSQQQYLDHAARQVLDWDEDETEKLAGVVEALRAKLAPWRLPLPPVVLVVKTTGREENGGAYCRGATVVFPQGELDQSPRSLERLLTHELFHVLSNQNPALRRQLYAVVGFRPCTDIALPESLRSRKLTNPDAPEINYYAEVRHAGATVRVVPVLFAKEADYDPERDGGLFRILTFRLMVVEQVVEQAGDTWRPVERDGEPTLLDVADVPDYYEKIGRNTEYIIHCEEVLAENFVLLINEQEDVPTPRVIEGMRKVLGE